MVFSVSVWIFFTLPFSFLALPMEFFGTFGIFIKGINGIANCEDNLYFWFVKRMNGRDDDPISNPVCEYYQLEGEGEERGEEGEGSDIYGW